jgi:short-subunit dehydrogenase
VLFHIGTLRIAGRNVASVSAHRIDPGAAVYCATKLAVRALSEVLHQESRDLRVTVICPGLTRTELFDGFAVSRPESVDVSWRASSSVRGSSR